MEDLSKKELLEVKNEDVNLEDLLILGEDKKIPITIEFPKTNGEKVKAKALVKQLTLKELDNIKINNNNLLQANIMILEKALLKHNGDYFTADEIKELPLGVVNALAEKIMELSGVDDARNKELVNF